MIFMKRGLVLALAAALSACAPAPVQMPAAQASEVLNLFAAGRGPANLCSADGRALLRGAVRAYSREMERSGVAWPMMPGAGGETQPVTHVDVSVVIAFAAGFVEASDFRGQARALVRQVSFAQWPVIAEMRQAARVACEQVADLQQSAARFVLEASRYESLSADAGESARAQDSVARQAQRMQRARAQMEMRAAQVDAAVREARES
jgi:hypothetical protein